MAIKHVQTQNSSWLSIGAGLTPRQYCYVHCQVIENSGHRGCLGGEIRPSTKERGVLIMNTELCHFILFKASQVSGGMRACIVSIGACRNTAWLSLM